VPKKDEDGNGDNQDNPHPKKKQRRLRISVHEGVFKALQEADPGTPVKGPP